MAELTDDELVQMIRAIGLRRPRGGSERKPIAHGTPKGYKQHRYRGEQACDDCLRAERDNGREKYQARRAPRPGSDSAAGQEELMTPAEVAAAFGVRVSTLRRWEKAGKLTAVRTPGGHRRYRADQVQALRAGAA